MSVSKRGSSSSCMPSIGVELDDLFSVTVCDAKTPLTNFNSTMYWEESNSMLAPCLVGFSSERVTVQRSNRRELLIVGESLSYCSRFAQTIQLPENANAEETVTLIHNETMTVRRRRGKKVSPACVTGWRRRFL